jgi:hypothetical protein
MPPLHGSWGRDEVLGLEDMDAFVAGGDSDERLTVNVAHQVVLWMDIGTRREEIPVAENKRKMWLWNCWSRLVHTLLCR